MNVSPRSPRPLLIAALLAGVALAAQAQEQGRVLSSAPITEQGRVTGYSVSYEYGGHTYTTRTDSPPGPTVPVQVGAYGVTTYPVAPQPSLSAAPATAIPAPGPELSQVTPEPGVVVSGSGAPYGTPYSAPYGAPPAYYVAPGYPAPVYAAPVYAAPAYAYPPGYIYPPIGLSLSLGYARGWHHRGWR